MRMIELFEAVKEKNLSKDQLEDYRDELSNLTASMFIHMAELEKEEAVYLDTCEEETDVAKRRKWRATPHGLKQIEIKNYIKASEKILASLRSRLYSLY